MIRLQKKSGRPKRTSSGPFPSRIRDMSRRTIKPCSQRERLERLTSFLGPDASEPSEPLGQLAKRESLITFRNPKAQEFFVDGTKIPDGAHSCHDLFGRVLMPPQITSEL